MLSRLLVKPALSNWTLKLSTSKVSRALCSSTTTKTSTPEKCCPIQLVGKQYLPNPRFTGQMPSLDRLNYINSDIIFKNYHSDTVAIAFSTDYDLCIRMNAVPGQSLLHIFFPDMIRSEHMNQSFVEECMDFFENKYPLTPRLKSLYNSASIDFCRSCCRIIATMDYLSPELRNTYFLAFTLLILFDDISETLTLLPDPHPLSAFRHNNARIIHQRQEMMPRIDLSAISSFPRELLHLAQLHEDVFQDLHQRIRRHASVGVSRWHARAWDYFMDGVQLEPRLCQEASNGQLTKYSKAEMIAERAHSIGATVANSISNTDFCVSFLSPQDALISMSESAICSESDASTYFKEKLENENQGRIVSVNTMDWYMQVKGMTEHEALVECYNTRNHIMKAMMDVLPHIQPHHQARYRRAIEAVLIYNDYSLVGGINQQNNRYGWYPALRKQPEGAH